MKYHYLLPLVAVAMAGVVREDTAAHEQVVLQGDHHDDSFWESIPGRQDVVTSIEDAIGRVGHTFDNAIDAITRTGRRVVDSLREGAKPVTNDSHHRKGRHQKSKETVWELIRDSRHAKRFAKLVKEFEDVRTRLDDKDKEYTVFVPTDEAFENLPEHEKPSREFLEKILEYHVVPGIYSAGRIMSTHTIPTVLQERELGKFAQRIRVSVRLFGIYLNFYSQLITADIVSLFPSNVST
jgi:uncharacterized surface protein with fasciclin (FAS1) repeats